MTGSVEPASNQLRGAENGGPEDAPGANLRLATLRTDAASRRTSGGLDDRPCSC